MDLYGAVHGWGVQKGPLPKICHKYPTMMKLGTGILTERKSKKYMCHTRRVLVTSAFFHRKSASFSISKDTDMIAF